ncbi:hypothetical protein EV401DRAFT_610325 [Pisolithus croceorrhizus]|nr:hypothetical protein EV401DRAFT_610325 [Pisolithus croceorrhizus]
MCPRMPYCHTISSNGLSPGPDLVVCLSAARHWTSLPPEFRMSLRVHLHNDVHSASLRSIYVSRQQHFQSSRFPQLKSCLTTKAVPGLTMTGLLRTRIRCSVLFPGQFSRHLRVHGVTGNNAAAMSCGWVACDAPQMNRGNILRHVFEMHLELRFDCSDCGMSFSRRTSLNNHRRREHSEAEHKH